MDAFALTPSADVDFARRRCFAMLGEVSPVLTRDDDMRLKFVGWTIGRDLDTMSGLSPRQYDWITAKVRELPDDRRAALVEAATLARQVPAIDADALTGACRQDLAPAETTDEVEALLDRIGEVGAEILWSLGDVANVLLAAAPPGSLKRDVLAEYLRAHEDLKPLLSSAAPSEGEIDPSAVNRWLYYARVASRVPIETRMEFAEIPYGYFACAATTLETRGGIRVPPSLAEIERRLSAVGDNETRFRKPSDLRAWLMGGSKTAADGTPERPDYAALAFQAVVDEIEMDAPLDVAWKRAFGPGGEFHIVKRRATR